MFYVIKESFDISFRHIIRSAILYHFYDFLYRLMTVSVWSESKALIIKLWFINLLQDLLCDCAVHHFIFITEYSKWSHFAFCILENINSSRRIWSVTASFHFFTRFSRFSSRFCSYFSLVTLSIPHALFLSIVLWIAVHVFHF